MMHVVYECGVVVDAAELFGVFEKLLICWDFTAHPSLVLKKRFYLCSGKLQLLLYTVRSRLYSNTKRNQSASTNVCRRASMNDCGRWAPAAGGLTCQQEPED